MTNLQKLNRPLVRKNKIWFAGENKTVKYMLDYIISRQGADFSLEIKQDGRAYIQGYDNGWKPRGRMYIDEAEIMYLCESTLYENPYWKKKLDVLGDKKC